MREGRRGGDKRFLQKSYKSLKSWQRIFSEGRKGREMGYFVHVLAGAVCLSSLAGDNVGISLAANRQRLKACAQVSNIRRLSTVQTGCRTLIEAISTVRKVKMDTYLGKSPEFEGIFAIPLNKTGTSHFTLHFTMVYDPSRGSRSSAT
jgi:hypothetical protein